MIKSKRGRKPKVESQVEAKTSTTRHGPKRQSILQNTQLTITLRRGRSKGKINVTIEAPFNSETNNVGTNVDTTNTQPTITLRRGRSKGKINVTNEAPTNINSEATSTENLSTGHSVKRKLEISPVIVIMKKKI
ncbi:3817_t:CDS:2 [Diversispora eburnea]|uniref:3817_t:CDS:1 n=1 Tax=Diversispora eburnea TaxID=1213867 RepID=A0A9N9FNA1_9GLOM|nr:3817_t:CDS:2 [Diversispora eburnea]